MNTINTVNFEQARRNLTHFMIAKADELRRVIGFGYIDVADAPDTYEKLVAAYGHSLDTNFALPVWNGASENTIYTNREGNLAFRYVHDVYHVIHKFQFNLVDEVKNADRLGEQIANEFGGKTSLEYRMYMADTAGQSIYAETHNGNFPTNQLAFVRALLADY